MVWLMGHRRDVRGGATAVSLLVFTEQPLPSRLFLKKSRTSPDFPVQSRSENALRMPGGPPLAVPIPNDRGVQGMHRMRSNFCQTRGRLDGMRVHPSVQEVHIQL